MNKKLFKGALVLFASVLMAVSCSSNTNPGGDGTTDEKFSLALKKATDGQIANTTLGAKIKDASSGSVPDTTLDIALTGTDISDKNKYTVEVTAVAGQGASAKTGNATSSIHSTGVATTYTDLSDVSELTTSNIALNQETKGKLVLSFTDDGSATLGKALKAKLDAKAKYGVIKVDFKVTEKSTKKEVKLSVYVELGTDAA